MKKTLSIRVDEDTYEAIEKAAEDDNRSMSWVAAELLKQATREGISLQNGKRHKSKSKPI